MTFDEANHILGIYNNVPYEQRVSAMNAFNIKHYGTICMSCERSNYCKASYIFIKSCDFFKQKDKP